MCTEKLREHGKLIQIGLCSQLAKFSGLGTGLVTNFSIQVTRHSASGLICNPLPFWRFLALLIDLAQARAVCLGEAGQRAGVQAAA